MYVQTSSSAKREPIHKHFKTMTFSHKQIKKALQFCSAFFEFGPEGRIQTIVIDQRHTLKNVDLCEGDWVGRSV